MNHNHDTQPWDPSELSVDREATELPFASLRLDAFGTIVEYSGAGFADLNLSPEESLHAGLPDIWHGHDHLYAFIQRLLAGAAASVTVRSLGFDHVGRPRVHRVFGTPLAEGGAVIMAFRVPMNYVSSRDYQASLKNAAETDSLTGVFNRRGFNEELEAALGFDTNTAGLRGAVIYMDLDNFKAINDTLGHAAGDEVLISITRCLSANLRNSNALARLGGDEFAVLLRDVGSKGALAVARRLLRAVREHKTQVADRAVSCTLSAGVALYPEHGATPATLLHSADIAMYRVKTSGRNNVHLYTDPLSARKAA